ncbi:MAG: NUDIX hydrolase [Syntrophaceae bacterium]|nr:NUDIX hydrolase [Syntrophaceae bacterium]
MYATPTDAATVMLLRPRANAAEKAIEVLMVLRNRRSRFVPGYHVYPGGILDAEDYEPGIERFCRGIDRARASGILHDMSSPEKALGAWVAGIRESFEEVGMLIALRRDGSPVTIETEAERRRFCGYRKALNRGEMKFREMLEKEGLILPLERLHYFSHWITPEPLPLRYDVRFFLAEAPAAQAVNHDGKELTQHRWFTPAEALEEYEKGRIGLVLPQIMTLVDVSRFRTVEEAIAATIDRQVPANLTKIRRIGGADVEVMPDGTAYERRPPVYSWPEKE